ncbi:hypothetical protein [Streptomyces sp. NPDC094031]|uniref:hypothetical protein n=1 Tax=Streptomyces sp. NPDC094031 TaxID=3155307 RepID=UPI003328A9E9
MTLPEQTPIENEPGQQTGQTPPGQKPDEQAPTSGAGAGGTSGTPEDELPDWARKELAKVRGEAAGYRTRLRDAETKLSEAKSAEEFEAAVTEVKQQNAALERSLVIASVARRFDLPEELAGRLRGTTPEELEADAKSLQSLLAPKVPTALGGGLDPSEGDDGEMDPRALARRSRRY